MINCLAGILIPEYRGFSLIRNADAVNISGSQICLGQCFPGDRTLCFPYFHRIVFDPSCLREVLCELLLSYADLITFLVVNDASRTRRALIQSQLKEIMASLPRGQQLGGILFTAFPLPRTATGKVKRWEINI